MQRGGVGLPLADNYLVLEKGPKVFKLQLDERTEVVSNRLKPHAGQAPPAAAEPLRRGLPPGRSTRSC